MRALMSVPAKEDADARTAISDLLEECSKTGGPLPELTEITRRYAVRVKLTDEVTVGDWLDQWLEGKAALRRTSRSSYEGHVRNHLKPHLGHHRLGKLEVVHVEQMFAKITEQNAAILLANAERAAVRDRLNATPNKGAAHRALRKELRGQLAGLPPFRRITDVATQHSIRRTLRAALNVAIRRQIIPNLNVASLTELPAPKPRKAVLWTPERIRAWEKTGVRPSPVMVWPPHLIGRFLDGIADHRLYTFFHLIAFRGLRRGEACGARWTDLDEENASLNVAVQLVQDGWDVYEGIPKTEAGSRDVAMDTESMSLLTRQRVVQRDEFVALGLDPADAVRIFTDEDGKELHPGKITDLFERLIASLGLPPIRLHDLRHCAATLALAANVDIKIVSKMLGHSSTTITREIYGTVLRELFHAAAEAVVALVPRARRAGVAGA
ncbi:site-specific integrase [Streptacidiphilus neutrinimicus]|uniref:site-specific integrase n=1 Tax=Streptacidiphilus neutrinimicus TaxID=105420 RepID=UPI001F327B02|nr:site-specific integrase [Streptacidiphilus neutrinimicus]